MPLYWKENTTTQLGFEPLSGEQRLLSVDHRLQD